jgi:uncharacterized membrane protein
MTKMNYVFLISVLGALLGFILLEEVGTSFYAGFLAIGGCILGAFSGGFSTMEYFDPP